jgi:TadE-like protein
VNRLIRDCSGGSLIEFTLVFPVTILVTLGTVDATYMLYEWGLANKAAYRGARTAIVRDPVTPAAIPSSGAYTSADIGDLCFDPATGAAVSPPKCPTFTYICSVPANAGTCPNFDAAKFNIILAQMQVVFPRLQSGHVVIRYETSGLGFAGRPGGLPMSVTVSFKCLTHEFFFLKGLMGWAFTAPANPCPAGPAGPPMPAFATTLPSEDMSIAGT